MRGRELLALILCAGCGAVPKAAPAPAIGLRADHVLVDAGGEPFTEYVTAAPFPMLFPLRAPGGVPVTATAPADHLHHRSLWFAHGDVNGVDFWTGKGTIVSIGCELDAGAACIRAQDVWRAPDGSEVCRDRRTLHFAAGADWRTVDFDVELLASNGELRLGDTKEGTMALRLRPELALTGAVARGTAQNSEGVTGVQVWGKRARWVAYAAVVDGQQLCVAMFDHPQNPAYPTWWHARDYGLFAANPFGVHDFTGGPAGAGARTVPEGGSMRFRYRVWLHRGTADAKAIDAACAEWLAGR